MAHRDPRKAAATEQGWDSYGAPPTSEAAIRTAENFVWVPKSDGGLMLDANHDGVEVEVDINEAGQITSVCFECKK